MKNLTYNSRGAKLLQQATAKALTEPGAKWTPETGWTNDPTLPERVLMEGNTYRVINDGLDRSYCLVAETVTFNGKPGTPIEEVERLAEATGSKMTGTNLRWGTIAFADALKSGEITPVK